MAKKTGKKAAGRQPINIETPTRLFIVYIFAALVLLCAFRAVAPGEAPPLPIFAVSWRIVRGILLFIEVFPALALSALVMPYGFYQGTNGAERFSPEFMNRMAQPVITAIIAAALYGALFSFALPLAGNRAQSMRFRGELFAASAQKAREHADEGAWGEAGRLLEVCERIWPQSPALEELRIRVDMEIEGSRYAVDSRYLREREEIPAGPDPRNRNPVNAAEALTFAEEAFGEERYFDSHWLATLAERLARPGSVEVASAAEMAARAWNAITSLAPLAREQEAARLYRLKQSGYEAMISGDWIRGYYIFREFLALSPDDPDAANFLAACERGALEIAFFSDELEMTLGDLLSAAIISIPRKNESGGEDGHIVLRAGQLSTSTDYAYGFDLEMLTVDREGRLVSRLEAPYVKMLPKTLGGEARLVLLFDALDRDDRTLRWGAVWAGPDRTGPAPPEAVLDLAWDDFLLMAKVRRGIDNLLPPELITAYQVLEPYGYIPEVFLAEICKRLAEPVFFLPFALFMLVTGWRYRARRRLRYIAVPMLVLMPAVFYVILEMCRSLINTLSIWVALYLDFAPAMAALAFSALALFILALFVLAGQQG